MGLSLPVKLLVVFLVLMSKTGSQQYLIISLLRLAITRAYCSAKADLPALRAKAETPEGQAILQRLRYQLNAGDGRSMAKIFSDFTHAYMGGGYRHHTLSDPGVYTFSHVVGYGLLYQLTGEQIYADLGRVVGTRLCRSA